MAKQSHLKKNDRSHLWKSMESRHPVIPIELNHENSVNDQPNHENFLKFVVVSDTHCQMEEIMEIIPDGDVFVHCGDFTNYGEYDRIVEFNEQLGRLPHRHKIVVAGNHELGFEDDEDISKRAPEMQFEGTSEGYKLITNAHCLHDKSIEIEGLKIYGSSWHPLSGYGFHVEPGTEMEKKWKKIPRGTDILITHGPPLGYNDLRDPGVHWGDHELLQAVKEIRPSYHLYGHMHEGYGICSNEETTFINSAIANKHGRLVRKPIVFYVDLT